MSSGVQPSNSRNYQFVTGFKRKRKVIMTKPHNLKSHFAFIGLSRRKAIFLGILLITEETAHCANTVTHTMDAVHRSGPSVFLNTRASPSRHTRNRKARSARPIYFSPTITSLTASYTLPLNEQLRKTASITMQRRQLAPSQTDPVSRSSSPLPKSDHERSSRQCRVRK